MPFCRQEPTLRTRSRRWTRNRWALSVWHRHFLLTKHSQMCWALPVSRWHQSNTEYLAPHTWKFINNHFKSTKFDHFRYVFEHNPTWFCYLEAIIAHFSTYCSCLVTKWICTCPSPVSISIFYSIFNNFPQQIDGNVFRSKIWVYCFSRIVTIKQIHVSAQSHAIRQTLTDVKIRRKPTHWHRSVRSLTHSPICVIHDCFTIKALNSTISNALSNVFFILKQ